MRRPCVAALLTCLLLPTAAWAEGIGAFLTLSAARVHLEGPGRGQQHQLPAQRAYDVVDVAADGGDTVWYRVVLPELQRTVRGEGWVSLEPHEVKERGSSAVMVFRNVPENEGGPVPESDVEIASVPATAITLEGTSRESEAFAPLRWHKVRYTMQRPVRGWLQADAGVFRPGKDAAFLARAFREMSGQSLDTGLRRRLLSGVVRVGDTPREVEWALGSPTHVSEEQLNGTNRATWQYASVQVVFENAVVKQID